MDNFSILYQFLNNLNAKFVQTNHRQKIEIVGPRSSMANRLRLHQCWTKLKDWRYWCFERKIGTKIDNEWCYGKK